MRLVLRLILVPGMVAVVSLTGRRWGAGIGGWMTGLPVVTAPTLFFLALEQGDTFAAQAAGATLVGQIAVAAFSLTYAEMCVRAAWPVSLFTAWVVFATTSVLLNELRWHPIVALFASIGGFEVVDRLLPRQRGELPRGVPPTWELALRMGAAVALVLVVMALATPLGPKLTGALTPFPLALAILVAFAHRQGGPPAALRWLRACLRTMWSTAGFCFVLSLATVPLGRETGFLAAFTVLSVVNGFVLWRIPAHRPQQRGDRPTVTSAEVVRPIEEFWRRRWTKPRSRAS
jgi:hypothetical protein